MEKHPEKIICPECNKYQYALVEHTDPWYTYLHECEQCNYIITESEWESLPKEAAKTRVKVIITLGNGVNHQMGMNVTEGIVFDNVVKPIIMSNRLILPAICGIGTENAAVATITYTGSGTFITGAKLVSILDPDNEILAMDHYKNTIEYLPDDSNGTGCI